MGTTTKEKSAGVVQELGGKLKKGVGRLLGDDEMELEGAVKEQVGVERQEDAKAVDRLKGAVEEVTGAVKGGIGHILGDDQMELEGKARKAKGQVRQQLNQPRDAK